MHEEAIPIVMFAVIGIVMGLFYYFRYRTRAEMQHTVRIALERGQELDPELVDRLGEPRAMPFQDLRRGLISIFLAIGLGVFGFVLNEEDAVRPLLATAMLPLAVGAAYVILWQVGRSRESS